MTTSKVLVIVGNPFADSYDHALAVAYLEGLGDAAEARVIDLATDPVPASPTDRDQVRARGVEEPDGLAHLEPVVAEYIETLEWADHIVVIYPQWWGTYPAVLKAFIDRVFLAGRAFTYKSSGLPNQYYKGRTVRFVMTADAPGFWNRLMYRNASETSLKRAIFGYVGIKTVGFTRFRPMRTSTDSKRAGWLSKVNEIGRRDARRYGRTGERVLSST